MLWKCDQQDILFENCQNVTFRIPKRELFDKIKIHGRVYRVLSPWFTESEISAKAYSKWRLREELPKRDPWCQKRTRRRAGATLRRSGKWGVRLLQIIGAGGGPCPPRSPAYYSFFTGPRFLVACVRVLEEGLALFVPRVTTREGTTCHQRTSIQSQQLLREEVHATDSNRVD